MKKVTKSAKDLRLSKILDYLTDLGWEYTCGCMTRSGMQTYDELMQYVWHAAVCKPMTNSCKRGRIQGQMLWSLMAYCDVCGNYDKQHVEDIQENVSTVPDEDYQPDLYYYWDQPIEEDYDWRDAYPNVDCMCEICFDIANSEKKIQWDIPRCQSRL